MSNTRQTPADDYYEQNPPMCIKCGKKEHIQYLGHVHTDFGGKVIVWVCRADGIAAIMNLGSRP